MTSSLCAVTSYLVMVELNRQLVLILTKERINQKEIQLRVQVEMQVYV